MTVHLILVTIVVSLFALDPSVCQEENLLWMEDGNVNRDVAVISRGKTASQSSIGWDGHAHYGNDGNTNQDYNARSCTHTNADRNPWWKLDLGSRHRITGVKVWNRRDCCGFRLNSLKVQVSDNEVDWRDIGALKEQATEGSIHKISTRGRGRYVRLILAKPEPEYLTLCEVEVYGFQVPDVVDDTPPSDVAVISRGKTASQSSIGWDGHALYAIDGNTNQDYNAKSCTHTQGERNPWWKLDLGSRHRVTGVKVWNRRDCCGSRLNSLKVQVSDNEVDWREIGALNEPAADGGIYTINARGRGRYVRLILGKLEADYLTLCEVEVYGQQLADDSAIAENNPQGESSVISRGKPASQSSIGWDGHAYYGNDGNTNQDYNARSCTHTQGERNPWWKLDFGSRHHITGVKVWNRRDCCGSRLNSLKAQVSDNEVDWRDIGALNEQATDGGIYTINARGGGRYFRLILGKPEAEYLTLCEVEVYGFPISDQ